MECNQQYALYDGDASGPQKWVAHVRLTPELLQRLQQKPASVTIQLQAPGGGGSGGSTRPAARTPKSNKPSSVLRIVDTNDGADGDEPSVETYEMLSFTEDPKVNAVCAFRADESKEEQEDGMDTDREGYSLHNVGSVFQKLIVQRMLDSTEKDRMKDRHAKSVLESKSRASKFVPADEATGLSRARSTRGKQLALKGVALAHPPGFSAKRGTEQVTPIKKRKLPSALADAAVQELQDRIARGPVCMEESFADEQGPSTTDPPRDPQSKSTIFSSDSEEDTPSSEPPRVVALETSEQADSKQSEHKNIPTKKAARKATAKVESKTQEIKSDTPDTDSVAQPKSPRCSTKGAVDTKPVESVEEQLTSVSTTDPAEAGTKRKAVDEPTMEPTAAVAFKVNLPAVRATKEETKKRARPRLSRLPDMSLMPPRVQDICKRVSTYITRTAILDANDHEAFTAEHDRLRGEWEELDKAYSIESILTDGAHFQLPFATTEEEKQLLRTTIQAGEKKREGLLFVRDSMATIHKILASLQTSISAYEQKNLPP